MKKANSVKQTNSYINYLKKIKMRRLFNKWTAGTTIFMLIIKTLQLAKKMGFSAKENGWRKISGTFLRNEYSKFVLASFRLNYTLSRAVPSSSAEAKIILINNLFNFLHNTPETHWGLKWTTFRMKRIPIYFTDIMEAEFNKSGDLLKIIPHFDNKNSDFKKLPYNIIENTLNELIDLYNSTKIKKIPTHKKACYIRKRLFKWSKSLNLAYSGKTEFKHLIERILYSTFINFNILNEENKSTISTRRLKSPRKKNKKHPGLGLMNITCRFPNDLTETDMWFEYHHVPVDGKLMQETLQKLKLQWGEAKPIVLPNIQELSKPEISYCGNEIFKSVVFLCFDRFLKIRNHLNKYYYNEMRGPVTISSMLMWGISHHKLFKDCKFVLPLDTDINTQNRDLSLIFIYPNNFKDKKNYLKGFLKYQREFNNKIHSTKLGKSESHEFLELLSMLHPSFYTIFNKFFPQTIRNLFGSVGLTILKDAEMFIGPTTDLHTDGFMGFGNLKMPTEDGRTVGSASILAPKNKIFQYINILKLTTENFDKYIGLQLEKN